MMTNLFFELIKVSLGAQSRLSSIPSVDEWQELYNIAKKQSLIGVCFVGVQKLQAQDQCLPEMLYLKWMGIAAKIQQQNEVNNRLCEELYQKLKTDGFESCILKGQAVGSLYSQDLHNLRQPGDIDVWIDGSHSQIMEYINSISPTDKVRWLHSQFDIFPNLEVEVHFRPSYLECPWQDRALQKFFDSEKNSCFSLGRCSDRFNQIFILAHAFRHLYSEGVGLRQLMDYYFVLKNSKERLSCNEFYDIMNATGMFRFAKAVMWIMKEVFGLEEELLLCIPSERNGRFLLHEVVQSGNFGYLDSRVKHSSKENEFYRFWRISLYNFRAMRFSPWIVVCSPFWRIWHWCWRKQKGYK